MHCNANFCSATEYKGNANQTLHIFSVKWFLILNYKVKLQMLNNKAGNNLYMHFSFFGTKATWSLTG